MFFSLTCDTVLSTFLNVIGNGILDRNGIIKTEKLNS